MTYEEYLKKKKENEPEDISSYKNMGNENDFNYEKYKQMKESGQVYYDTEAVKNYFSQAQSLFSELPEDNNDPTYDFANKGKEYSDRISGLAGDERYISMYLNSIKGTSEYEQLSKQFNDYRNALSKTKDYLNELYGFASQYDNEEDYNKAVTEINRRQKYQGKSYDELIDASKNTEDEDESKWLKNYAEETVSYDDIKGKYDGVKQREAEVNAKIKEYMQEEMDTTSIEKKQYYASLLDPLYAESEEIEKQLRDIKPVYDSKTAEKNNAEYAKKYEGLNYAELKAKISDVDSEGEKKWLENKADEAATSADYEKEIAELEAKQKERYAENGWGGSDQYGGEIRTLKDKLALKQREEKAAEYEKSVRENGDFDEQSKRYDGGAIQNVVDVVTPDIDNSDSVYKFINTVSTNDELTHNPLAFVTDDERKTFNYLYNSGKKDEATEYIKSIQRSLNERYTQSNNEKAAEYAKEHPYLASAVSLGTNLISGTGVIEDVGNRLIGEPIDTNSPMHYGANQTRALRGTVKDTYFNDVGTFGYDTVMSAVDSAVLIGLSSITGGAAGAAFGGSEAAAAAIAGKVTSTASSIIMGSQVATNTVIDAKERGLTDDQAVILGVLYGAVEALSEKYSIEHWLGNPKSIGSYLGKAFVAEGSEEVAANWGDRLADLLVTGDKNQVNQMYQDYIKQGYSDKEAFTLTAYNLIGEDTQAFIAGGVSGAAMSGTHMAVSGVSNKIGEVRTKNAVANLTASELTKSENKETLNSTIDFVKNNAESGSKEFKFSEKLGQAIENGETISVKDAKMLLKYSDNLDQKKYDTATKGFTNEEKAIVNNAVHKLTHRQSLSEQEYAQIKGNDKIIKAVSDYSGIEQDEVVELLDSSKFKDNLKYYKSNGNGLLEIDGKEFRGTVEIEDTDPATGKATLKLTSPDGKDVRLISSDNANFKNDTEARLYATAANFKNPNEANAFVENYNGGDFNEYLNEWNLYSNYGSLGFNAKQIYQRINQNVDTPSRKAAYYSGMENFKAFAQIQNINKRAYEAAAQSFKGYQRGTFVSNVSSERLNKMSRAQRNSIRELKMFTFAGLNVELFESKADKHGNYQGENGSFNAKTKTLRVDINAGYSNNEQAIKEAAKAYIRLTVGHELTHAAEQGGGYMKLRSEIIRTLEAAGFDYKRLVDKKLNKLNSQDKYKGIGKDKLYRLADSEVIADCCETLLNDSKLFEKLFNADKTLAEKFINAVKRAIEKLRQFFKENPTYARTEYGKALQEAMSKVENRVQELWDEAVAQGIRAEKNIDSSIEFDKKFSFREYNDFINSVNAELLQLADNVDNGDLEFKRINLSKCSKKQVADVKRLIGIDISGYSNSINTSGVKHIIDRHGKSGEHDNTMRNNNDIARVDYVLNNYDSVDYLRKDGKIVYSTGYSDINNNPAPFLVYTKTFGDTIFVVQAVGENKNKKLWVNSAYLKIKNSTVTQAPNAKALGSTSNNGLASPVPTNNIPQNKTNFNTSVQNSDRVIEENRDLVAVHNLSQEKLLKSLKLGGLAMPSIAVTNSEHTGFGEISLIFGKDTINPDVNSDNKVYSGDAWTPMFPNVEYEADSRKAKKLYDRAREAVKDGAIEFFNPVSLHPDNIEDRLNRSKGEEELKAELKKDYGFKNFYLKETTGESVKLKRKETKSVLSKDDIEEYSFLYEQMPRAFDELESMSGKEWISKYGDTFRTARENYIKQFFPDISQDELDNAIGYEKGFRVVQRARKILNYHKNGAETVTVSNDYEGARAEIDSKIDEKAYSEWINELFNGIEKTSGIYNGVDPYDSKGNSRSFSATHYEVTLENIVKAMKAEHNGKNSLAGTGIFGVAAKSYGTFGSMKADTDRLKSLTDEEYERIKESFGERFSEIAGHIAENGKQLSDNPYIDMEICFENILDGVRESKTKSGLVRYLKKYYGNVIDDSVATDILDLIADVGNMPTRYFEAKPQRAVGFDEVMAAVVPSSASDEVRAALQQAGIAIYEYERNNDKSRAEAMQSAIDTEYVDQSGQKYDDLRFQDRYNEFDDLFDMGEDLFEDDSKREIFDEMIEKYPYEALYIIQNAAEQTVENILTKTKSVKLDDSTYLYVARKFMQAYNISRAANPEEDNYLAAKIKNIVARIEAGELSQSEIMNEFINTASDALVLSGTLDDTMKNEREFVISLIKGKTLLVTDQQEDHIRENYGDLRRYRTTLGHGYVALEKNAKKKSITGAQGVYIEDIIEEVQEAYPQLIDEDANQITGFGWLEKLLNERLEPTFKSDSYSTPEIDAVNGGYEIMTNLVDQKARQIVRDNKNGQKYAKLGQTARELAQEQRKAVKEAVSKVKEEERQKAKKDIKEAREKAEARYKAKLEKKEQQFKEKLDEQRAKTRELRREKNDVIIAEKQKRVNDLRRLRDNRERREVIEKINKTAAKMRQMILRPTDTAYVPDEFKNGFIEVTDGITQALKLSDDTKIGQHLNKLSDLLRKLATDERTESVFGYEFDENFRKRVQEFAAVINGKKIDKSLTLREANDIHNLLKSVVTIVRNANKLINSQERRSISEAGIQIMLEQENLDSKWLNKQLKTIKKYFMTPLRMSEIINAYNDKAVLTKLVNEINRGVRKKNMFFMVANKMFDDYREKNVKELDHSSKDVREIRWTDNAGNSRVTRMTGMQAMQICMTWNREIADDNLVHISEGGLTIFDPDQLAKGNNKKALEKATKIHGVNNSFITSVASSLTRFEKGYIDIAEQYFNEYSKDAINETSLALKHYKIANSKYYIPIKVDQNSIAKEIEGIKFDSSVENQGMFKTVAPKSRKSIYIQGLDSLINNHIQGVSNYYGLAIPIRNLNKTLNVRNAEYDADGVVVNENTVKDALNKNWGELAINNYEQMLTDLQNSRASKGEQNSKEINKFIRGFRSNFVTSVLNFNPSVTLKQAASYFTAGAYIDGSILGKGFAHFWAKYGRRGRYKALLDEIDSHTAQHYIRRQGLSSNEIADINDNWLSKAAQNTKIGRKITTSKIAQGIPSGFNPNKWIQNMDCLTTAMLWVATKDQVNRDFNKAKKEIGTDEYWQAVTDLYDKVIEDTQPMYDPLHRPEVLKSSNELVKSIFMFKTQPLQNAGIIYDALGRAIQGNKGAIRKLGKAVASQTASLVTFALMTFVVSLARHNPRRYRDENDELTAESIFDQVIEDIFTNGMGILFPFGGTEIMTMFTQDGDAVQDNVAVQLNEFIGACRDLYDTIDKHNEAMSMGLETDPQDILTALGDFAVVVSQDITGLPVNNAIKNIEGVTGWIDDLTDGNGVLESTSEPKKKQVAGRYERQIENGNTAEAEKILNEFYQKELEKAKADKDIKDPESKAQANTRDMLANTYKTEYQEAFLKNDEKTMQKIVKILYSANKYMKWGKGKSQTPLDKKLEEWRKNAKDDIQKKH